ncbi:ribonuclease D [Parahaliea aestuarii]|uniref:Ribonuclease D n=1 Tax=Parahaliea aestuarii TaxID=1852021 RepID=A0A5C8ZZY6_9GAMM|nr:ribonuclease D [Parahaliea aestuarii]TXS93192.1 ribonuclease D [Parahaliea aestuarii]
MSSNSKQQWQLIEDSRTLEQVLADSAGADAVAVDTEFMRRNTFYPQVALLQLCFGDTAWLIDPLAIDDLGAIIDLMEDRSVVKVLHSPSEDLEVFSQWLGVLPEPLFDTQRAAALLDRGFGIGYRGLVESVCGVDLPKDETRSDWLQRPLSEAQCQYAAQDVLYLLAVYHELHQACAAAGKLDWVLADGGDAVAAHLAGPEPYYLRIKNAWKLNARQLGALAAISEWRERTARERDKPRSWIIADADCLQIARTLPETREQLRAAVELPPAAQRRYVDEVLEVLAAQRELPDEAMPAVLPPPPAARERDLAKRLKQEARIIAGKLQVAPEILLNSRDYDALVRLAGGGTLGEEPRHWQGWRREPVLEPLRALLAESRR